MEVKLTPDLQAKLSSLAAERGRDTQALVQEAIERFVDYDEWFLRELEKGLAEADRGELIEHEDIGKVIESRYPGGCVSAGRKRQPATSPASATKSRNVTARQPPDASRCKSMAGSAPSSINSAPVNFECAQLRTEGLAAGVLRLRPRPPAARARLGRRISFAISMTARYV